MSILLATLVLNEMEHLPKLYEQHKDWPGLDVWVFVESADKIYAQANPTMVSPEGLSVDGTTEYLSELTSSDSNLIHIKHGRSEHSNAAQGKCSSRQRYLDVAESVKPDFIFVLDADEYYTRLAQWEISDVMHWERKDASCFAQQHIWRPPSIADQPLFQYEVVGGFWGIPHCRGWRWQPGLRYSKNHNTPETKPGKLLTSGLERYDQDSNCPKCQHLGYASSLKTREAKHHYYIARGEGADRKRAWYTVSRAAFETWEPGQALPRRAKVIKYTGNIPEVFIDGRDCPTS